jgi:sugar lactone lactonase YvrE
MNKKSIKTGFICLILCLIVLCSLGIADLEQVGPYFSFESHNYPGEFIRHANFLGEKTPINSQLDQMDSTFALRLGLADQQDVSFESYNYPGYFLRHQNFRLKLNKISADQLFKEDATFKIVPGLADSNAISFKSYNYPNLYIRHKDGHLWVMEDDNSQLFKEDATYLKVPPKYSAEANVVPISGQTQNQNTSGLMSAYITHTQPENYSLVKQWGSADYGNKQYIIPYNVALDSSGNVYFVDNTMGSLHIRKFDRNGTYIAQLNSSYSVDGGFSSIPGVAVDSSDNVYVSGVDHIQKFDSNGNYLTQWGSSGTGNGQFNGPKGIAVDSLRNVYVADTGNHRIQKFDKNGKFLATWGSVGTGDGQFVSPEGVAVDSSDNVYVSGVDHIQKFDSNGIFLDKWGSSGTGNGQFNGPKGIAVDSLRNVYVADTGNNRIQKFDSNGTYLTQWGSKSEYSGQFEDPAGVAVDSSDNVYVADTANHRIEKFSVNNNPALVLSPVAHFSSNVTSGQAPVSVKFTDLSTNTEKWNWIFGDGATSTEQNPTHVYSGVGTYNVELTVSNAKGTDSKMDTIYAIAHVTT